MKAVIFVRTSEEYLQSTGGEETGNQLAKLRKFAEKNSYNILKEFQSIEPRNQFHNWFRMFPDYQIIIAFVILTYARNMGNGL